MKIIVMLANDDFKMNTVFLVDFIHWIYFLDEIRNLFITEASPIVVTASVSEQLILSVCVFLCMCECVFERENMWACRT